MAKLTPEQLCRNGSEHGEQSALMAWTADPATLAAFPDVAKLFAINNNAGVGDAIRGARAKMAGVKDGVADMFLPVARHGMHGLFLEMKQRKFKGRKNGGLSDNQVDFRSQVLDDGFGFATCHGWENAAEILRQYLSP